MIQVRPYDDLAAHAVLTRLDPADQLEAELVRGRAATGLSLFADWRAMGGAWIGAHVFLTSPAAGAMPFAVGAIVNTGQAGVASAALLARDHRRFRRPLTELALRLRAELPGFCSEHGIHRVEARCWAGHPTAPEFLSRIGFGLEAAMGGFGQTGAVTFLQFAWVDAAPGAPEIDPSQIASPPSPEEEQAPCA